MHVVLRQNFVPWISFHAKFEIAVPNIGWNTALDLKCRHMAVKFLATDDGMSQRGKDLAWPFENYGDWVDKSLVISRLMPIDRGFDRRHDVARIAVSRKKNFDT